MIYYEPTESDTDTRVPQKLILASCKLIGLEKLTGADWLITPAEADEILEGTNTKFERDALLEQCRKGMLIQRKAGRDALQAVPEYTRILHKMLAWSPMCWLVTIGKYSSTPWGTVSVDNEGTNWQWASYWQALMDWQLRGLNGYSGYYLNLPTDNMFTEWCLYQDKHILDGYADITWVPRMPIQKIAVPEELAEQEEALRVLMALPGIGLDSARKLLDYCGNLKMVFMLLSDMATFKKLKKADTREDNKLNGIGPETVRKLRELFQLTEQETLGIAYQDQVFRVVEVKVDTVEPLTPY